MTNEPFELLDQALREAALQSQNLSEKIARFYLYTLPDVNRRNLTPHGRCAERRRGERRVFGRVDAGRRELSDRRLKPQERIAEWQFELAEVLERSIKLHHLKRNLQT